MNVSSRASVHQGASMKGYIVHLCLKTATPLNAASRFLRRQIAASKYGVTFQIMQMLESVTAAIILLTSTIFPSALRSSVVMNWPFSPPGAASGLSGSQRRCTSFKWSGKLKAFVGHGKSLAFVLFFFSWDHLSAVNKTPLFHNK